MKKHYLHYYPLMLCPIIFFLLVQCKAHRIQENLINIYPQPSHKELNKNYYKYNLDTIYSYLDHKEFSFRPTIYTNIDKSPLFPNNPRKLFTPSIEEKNYEYFEKILNGEYVFYLEVNNKIIMREYAKYYDFSINSSNNKIINEKEIFNYLRNNNIKYELINKNDNNNTVEIKLLLKPNNLIGFIRASSVCIISNIYYDSTYAKPQFNILGSLFFK